MTESQLQNRINRELKTRGWLVNKPVTNSFNGMPDLHCYKEGGVTLFIEVKREGQKPRPLQLYWLQKLKNMGFMVYTISSIEEMNNMIHELENESYH